MIPAETFAAATRDAIESHQSWDSLHAFELLRWNGERLTVPMHAAIAPDVHPSKYRDLMTGLLSEHRSQHPDEAVHGLLLQIEAYSMKEPGRTPAWPSGTSSTPTAGTARSTNVPRR